MTTIVRTLLEGEWIDDQDFGNLLRTCKAIHQAVDDEELFWMVATRHQPFANNRYRLRPESKRVSSLLADFSGLDWQWMSRSKRRTEFVPPRELEQLYQRLWDHGTNQDKFQQAIFRLYRHITKSPSMPVDVGPYNNSWRALVKDQNSENCIKVKMFHPAVLFARPPQPTEHIFTLYGHALLWDRRSRRIYILTEVASEKDTMLDKKGVPTTWISLPKSTHEVPFQVQRKIPSDQFLKCLNLEHHPKPFILLSFSMEIFWEQWSGVVEIFAPSDSTVRSYFQLMFRIAAGGSDRSAKRSVLNAFFGESDLFYSDQKVLPRDFLDG